MSDNDCYITLTGKRQGLIKGEALISGFEHWIQVRRWRWGLEIPTAWNQDGTGGSAGHAFVGAPKVRLFSYAHPVDNSSAPLLAAAGNHEECTAEIVMRKAGGLGGPSSAAAHALKYLKIKFERVYVVSVDFLHDQDNLIPDQAVTFSFGKIDFEYVGQGSGGGAGSGGVKSWSHVLKEG